MGTTAYDTVQVGIENIGGIDELSLEFEPGVTVLAGTNATNRTSTLRALAAVIGSNKYTSIKSDADEGKVKMKISGEEYTRTLKKRAGGTSFGGNPLLDDPAAAENFAILLKSNDARQAIERQQGLRALVMEPVNIEKHEARLQELQNRRADIADNIEEREELKRRLPTKQEEIEQKKKELEQLREERDAKQEELNEKDLDPEEASDIQDEFEQKSNDLNDAKSKKSRLERSIDDTQDKIERLEDEIKEAEGQIQEIEAVEQSKIGQLESEVEKLENERRSLDAQRSDLGTVIDLNESLLNEGAISIFEDVENPGESGQGQLFPELEEEQAKPGANQFNCPTCGQSADEKQIRQTLQTLRNLRSEINDKRQNLIQKIDDKRGRKKELEEKAEEKKDAKATIKDNRSKIEDAESKIQQYEKELETVSEKIERLKTEREELKQKQRSEILELQGDISDLEFQISEKKEAISRAKDDLEKKEQRLEEMEDLEDDREEIKQEIRSVRDTIDKFNSQFETILDLLEYENIEQIKIDAKGKRDTSTLREEANVGEFEMTIARETDGTVYKDSYENLSESEQEVAGLLFALAGYLAHEVHKDLPLMLIDSVEAIDSDRIAALVDHFSQFSDNLIIALLEEDADALPKDYQYIDKFEEEGSTPALQ
jgi:predicted  nucleic acid-binding Zn-ribbon protein